jgi:hypothetical protein
LRYFPCTENECRRSSAVSQKQIMKIKGYMLLAGLVLAFGGIWAASPLQQPDSNSTSSDKINLPADYRTWIYLSSGLDMIYKEEQKMRTAFKADQPYFENVFVKPQAYQHFVQTGGWPDGTMFILERRFVGRKVSIDTTGSTQLGLDMVVGSTKTNGNWTYYIFDKSGSGEPQPRASCWDCHHQHGAVDNTFVQFYPTLKPTAIEKGTYNEKNTQPGK